MGGFVFFGALLGLLAIAFAISALWQRSPRLAIVLALAIPLAAGGLYWFKGRPAALEPANVAQPKTMEAAVAQLQRALKDEPDTFDNEIVLARSYMAIGKFPEAAQVYARALPKSPDNDDVAVEYAEAQLRASKDRRFPAAAVPLLEKAVDKNPQNQRALFFLGLQRMQAGRPADASAAWERLLPLLAPDAANALRPQVEAARKAAGLPPLPEAAFAGAPGLDVEVDIDPTLRKEVADGEALFVFARKADGAGPPLAVQRLRAGEWPVRLRLSDADSPMPTGKLSGAAQVVLQARLSRSWNAEGASGDLEADQVTVDTGTHERVRLMISRSRP
jgi:cytochrome c-type biogenesis protein CcmH